MSGHFVTSDRETPMLMSPSLQDWLPANHLARLIVETVERLDLRGIEDSYAGRGERAYRPKMLVALLLYGYATGVFSSRRLERACFDSVAFRFISANTSPDHDTIADFRKRILLSDIVAEAGYYSEANVVACEGAGVTPYLAMSRERHHSWLDAKLRKPDSAPAEDASPADRMAYRLQTPDGHELYAQRKSTVETTFGILKSAIGFRSFLLRGCEKVEGEWKLVCTAYNFKRLYGLVAACPKVQAAA
jgi:hypothetical protein